jgi:hypothetical protein
MGVFLPAISKSTPQYSAWTGKPAARRLSDPLLAATLDEHEDDALREHEFVNGLSPLSSSVVARGQAA